MTKFRKGGISKGTLDIIVAKNNVGKSIITTLYDPQCPNCKGEIQMGVAIHPGWEFGERICWINPPLLNHETIKMIDVYKCKCCGYSCDDEHNLNWKVNDD